MTGPRFDMGPPMLLICPRCGSHRTQVVGRREDGLTLVLRCSACGAHSVVVPGDPIPQLPPEDVAHSAPLWP
jgi:hypothetical protein